MQGFDEHRLAVVTVYKFPISDLSPSQTTSSKKLPACSGL